MKRFQVIWLALCLGSITATVSYATDGNGNGFDDEFERAIAAQFCPALVLEAGDEHVSPEPVEIMGPLMAAMLSLTGSGEYDGELLTGVAGGAYDYHNYDSWNDAKNHPYGFSQGDYGCGFRNSLTMFWHWDYAGTGEAPGGGNGPSCYQSLSGADYDQPLGWHLAYQNGRPSYTLNGGVVPALLPGSAYPTTTYCHEFKQDGKFVLQYWFFYPFNDWFSDHEGDWEHINVVVSSDDPAESQLQEVVYYFHNRYVFALKNQLQDATNYDYRVVDTFHPLVFVGGHCQKTIWTGETGSGYGSHGCYPATGHWAEVDNITSIGPVDDDVHGDGDFVDWRTFAWNSCEGSKYGIVLIRDHTSYNFATDKAMSWLWAKIPWGCQFVRSAGATNWIYPYVNEFIPPLGNNAPPSPERHDTWNAVDDPTDVVTLYGINPRPHANGTTFSPPPPASPPAVTISMFENASLSQTLHNIVSLSGSTCLAGGIVSLAWRTSGTNDAWATTGVTITKHYSPLIGDAYATWNTGVAPTGTYDLRAQVYIGGQTYEELKTVTVQHQNKTVATSGGNFTTIYSALSSSSVEMGDTLNISPGTYANTSSHPTLDVTKIVYLRSTGGVVEINPYQNSPIVSVSDADAHPTFDSVTFKRIASSTAPESYGVQVIASQVSFKNCSFLNMQAYDGYAINATGACNVELDGCTFDGNKPFGIGQVFSSVVSLAAVGTQKPTGYFVNCTFKNNSGHAVQIFYDSANPLQNTEPTPYFQGCKFTNNVCDDNVVTIRNSLRTINFFSCLFADNHVFPRYEFPEAAVFANNAKVWLDNCTIARNVSDAYPAWSVGAVSINTSGGPTQPITIDDSILAFNQGPAINKSDTQMPADIMLTRCITFGNTPPAGTGSFRTDAQWVNAGTNVLAEDPAFCNAANGDYQLYAFSPAAPDPIDEFGSGLPYTNRVGAYDVGCVPDAVVSVSAGDENNVPGPVLLTCPKGEAGMDHLIITTAFNVNNSVVTRPLLAMELSLQPPYVSMGIISSTKIHGTSSTGYSITLDHPYVSGYGANDHVTLYLDGYPLVPTATFAHRSPDMRGGVDSQGNPRPDGKVSLADLSWFVSNYPTGSFHPPYFEGADFVASTHDTISTPDFSFFTTHYAGAGHKYPGTGTLLQTVGEEQTASTHVVLGFTEEFVTALDHRLYVDVTLEDCADKNWVLFALKPNRPDLTLSSFEPTSWAASSAPFAPVETENGQELYFGVFMINDAAEATRHLGRIVFDVAGSDPVAITDDQFALTVGEVALANEAGGQAFVAGSEPEVYAHMGGVSGRVLNSTVQRVFHNRLEQNFPNPFNPQTTLAYSLKEASDVSLTIYNVLGQRVRELVNEHHVPGAYKVVWDGRNGKGAQVASGVYFYKLVAGSFVETKKMVMLK